MSTIFGDPPYMPQPVDVERAREHALFTLRRAFTPMQAPSPEDLLDGVVEHRHYEVYDLTDVVLFYLFPARIPGAARPGWVRAAAHELVGPPVLAIETPQTLWDPDAALERALTRAQEQFPQTFTDTARLVCYSYPKIGVRVALRDAGRRSVIYDAVSLEEIPNLGPGEPEGFAAWSYYQTIVAPRPHERMLIFRQADAELRAAQERLPALLAENLDPQTMVELRQALEGHLDVNVGPTSSRVLKYSLRCDSPGTHDCFALYAQRTDVFCAVATAQMILDFYRYEFTQDAIAAEMKTGPSGTGNAEQRVGYETLSRSGLVATIDSTPTWAEAKAEIDANRPVKSGIEGHARVCTGWMRENATLSVRPPRQWLQIHDPWPASPDPCTGGAVLWEDWDTVHHTNFIYVRHS